MQPTSQWAAEIAMAPALSQPEGGTSMFTPEQRTALRSAVRGRLSHAMRKGLADRLAETGLQTDLRTGLGITGLEVFFCVLFP